MDIAKIQSSISTLEELIKTYDPNEDNINNAKIFETLKDDLATESPTPLKNRIKYLKYEEYETIWDGMYERELISSWLSNDVELLLMFYKEKLFEITPVKTKDDLYKQKLLKAKNNNIDFFEELGEMVIGDADYFPYRSSSEITKFFAEAGYPDLKHDGSTRKLWAKYQLEKLSLDDLYNIIKSLFKQKYFQKTSTGKEVNKEKAKEALKNLINDSCKAEEFEEISDIFDVDVNTTLLFQPTITTKDNDLNSDIMDARKHFIDGEYKEAVNLIWDAFERIKSLYDKDKKKSASALVLQLSDEIKAPNNSDYTSKQEDLFFEKELRILTDVGNTYKIRHSEQKQKPIYDWRTQQYLFFRVLNLINLIHQKIGFSQLPKSD